ncbi:MAG TPA: hypothetical protein VHA35_01570 [Dongiaceae bacterium]|jgi:hypothetical protein|nr:hypothetical protein [Dongiaceae bacterium]
MTAVLLRLTLAAALAAALAGPAAAQDTPPTAGDAQKMAVEGLSKLLDALNLFVKSVPQYAAPEVLPNGDIIIRRLNPAPAPEKPKTPEPDETHT